MKNTIDHKIKAYTQRYVLRALSAGLLRFLALGTGLYLLLVGVEGLYWLPALARSLLMILFCISLGFLFIKWLLKPLLWCLGLKQPLDREHAAQQIGEHLPGVRDKLLNFLQLQSLKHPNSPSLRQASLEQRASLLTPLPLEKTLSLKPLKRLLPYASVSLLVALLLWILFPYFLSHSSLRLLQPHKTFLPPAPFSFLLLNDLLQGFAYEPFTVTVKVTGREKPKQVFLTSSLRQWKMTPTDQAHTYSHTFASLTESLRFHVEAESIRSLPYHIKIRHRPMLNTGFIRLQYPRYIGKKADIIPEIKNLSLPEGTHISWQLQTDHTTKVTFQLAEQAPPSDTKQLSKNTFTYEMTLGKKDLKYHLLLHNAHGQNKEQLSYVINSIPDRYPQLFPQTFTDSLLYRHIVLAGRAEDDHGLSRLRLEYRKNDQPIQTQPIGIAREPLSSFYFVWSTDSLNLNAKDQLRYRLVVSDNDAINGPKQTRTAWKTWQLPSEKEQQERLKQKEQQAQISLNRAKTASENMRQRWHRIREQLKVKKELSWQDRQNIEKTLKKAAIQKQKQQEIRQRYQEFVQQQAQFEKVYEKHKDKINALKKLFDELLDEKTKALYEKLQEQLSQNQGLNELQKTIQDIHQQEQLFDQELNRTLQLFKRLKVDLQIENIKEKIDNIKEHQDKLLQPNPPTSTPSQAQLREKTRALKEELKTLEKLNQDLKRPLPLPTSVWQQDLNDIEQNMKKAEQHIKQNKNPQSEQEKAKEKLEQLAKNIAQTQQKMSQQALDLNQKQVKKLLQNIINISFEQEELLKQLPSAKVNSKTYTELTRRQLNLQEATQPNLDSLNLLAEKLFKIEPNLNRYVQSTELGMEETSRALRIRNPYLGLIKQQKTMTYVNEIGRILDDLLDQMDQQAKGQGSSSGGKQKQPASAPPNSLSELQKQLNQRLRELKKNDGKQNQNSLSETFSKMVMEQERLRREVEDMMKKPENKLGEQQRRLQSIVRDMKKTEKDLANQHLRQDLLRRQKNIETRLLDSEQAERSQKESNQRKASPAAQDFLNKIPEELKKYRPQHNQIESFQYQNLPLLPYYEEAVRRYIRTLSESDETPK